jgi:hypothetical protein
MLERYDEALSTPNGAGQTFTHRHESAILSLDITWNASYRELDRCLGELRRASQQGIHQTIRCHIQGKEDRISCRSAWWNLRERYIDSRLVRREIRTHKGRLHLPRNSELYAGAPATHGKALVVLRVWDAKVEADRVNAAIGWIAERYRGVPALPKEMAA